MPMRSLSIVCSLLLLTSIVSGPSKADQAEVLACERLYQRIGITPLNTRKHDQTLCQGPLYISYDNAAKIPIWVLHQLRPEHLIGTANRKKARFAAATNVLSPAQLSDYKKSGYDRGHMAPAADFKYDQSAMNYSFRLNNIAPQVGHGFNRDIWRHLEEQVRVWVKARGALYVITGSIHDKNDKTIGSGVRVPSAFYKILYQEDSQWMVAFMMPNTALKGQSYRAYQTTVDAIETISDQNFFSDLPANIVDPLEAILMSLEMPLPCPKHRPVSYCLTQTSSP